MEKWINKGDKLVNAVEVTRKYDKRVFAAGKCEITQGEQGKFE